MKNGQVSDGRVEPTPPLYIYIIFYIILVYLVSGSGFILSNI